jgi:nucleotide-binding universal stress UspA family protein
MGHPISRRSLFKGAGAAAAAAVIAPGCERSHEVLSQRAPYSFLNADDAAFIEAAVAQRLPAIETSVVSGAPADMIVRDIEHSHTDLVVLGARGLGGIRRLLLGSVSEAVLTHATCSVLIAQAP